MFFLNFVLYLSNFKIFIKKHMGKEKLIGTFTVSNSKRIDLFRIHLFENSIRFDETFARGIIKQKELPEKILKISQSWNKKKVKDKKIFYEVLSVLNDYEKKLSKFYFKENELDRNGRYVEPTLIDTFDKTVNKEDIKKNYISLKKQGRLKKITKTEFEKNIKKREIIDYYIENYTNEKVTYYKYKAVDDAEIKDCYLLIKNNRPILGFEE